MVSVQHTSCEQGFLSQSLMCILDSSLRICTQNAISNQRPHIWDFQISTTSLNAQILAHLGTGSQREVGHLERVVWLPFQKNLNVLSFSIVGQLALCFHSNKETRRSQNTYLDIIIYQSWKSLCSKTTENIWIEGAEKPLWLLLLDPLCCSVAVSTCTSLGWLDCSDEGMKKIKTIQKTLDRIIHAL